MPEDIVIIVVVIALIILLILYTLVMAGVLIKITTKSITRYRNKNKGIKESISIVTKEMGFKTIPRIHIEAHRNIKDILMSFQGFRDIPEYDIKLHKMAQGSFDDATISFLNTTYNREIEGIPVRMEQSLITITSKKLHLPVFSLRSNEYWKIYRPTNRDSLIRLIDHCGAYKRTCAYGLRESPYFKSYQNIFSEEELEKMDDKDPLVRLDRHYTLATPDRGRKKLRKIITTDFMDTLEHNPFMIIEGNINHLLLMYGIGYYDRDIYSFEVSCENGYMLGTHTVEKVKIAIDLVRQLKTTIYPTVCPIEK